MMKAARCGVLLLMALLLLVCVPGAGFGATTPALDTTTLALPGYNSASLGPGAGGSGYEWENSYDWENEYDWENGSGEDNDWDDEDDSYDEEDIYVEELTASPDTVKLMVGGKAAAVKVKALYSDGEEEDVTADCEWEYDEEIVRVEGGKITPVAEGDTIVTAFFEDESVDIEVSVAAGPEIEELILKPESMSLTVGGKAQAVKVTAVYTDGKKKDVTKECEMESDDEEVATVEGCKVTPVGEGECSITVTCGDAEEIIEVTVTRKVKSLRAIDPDTEKPLKTTTIEEGGYADIIVYAKFADGDEEDVTEEVDWTSKNSSVADFEDGAIVANGVGSTTLTGTYGGKKVNVKVKVTAPK